MKIIFRTVYDGSIQTSTCEGGLVIADKSITEDGLEVAKDIARHQHQSVFKLLPHKVMYIALAADKVHDKDFSIVKVFVVRTKEGIFVWNVKLGYLTIENKDVIFTTEEEARAYIKKFETYDKMVARKAEITKELEELNKSIESLGAELGK